MTHQDEMKEGMNETILLVLTEYLKLNPSLRFGQALSNLGVNEFADKTNPEAKEFLLRDIYNDSDVDILSRMNENWKRIYYR